MPKHAIHFGSIINGNAIFTITLKTVPHNRSTCRLVFQKNRLDFPCLLPGIVWFLDWIRFFIFLISHFKLRRAWDCLTCIDESFNSINAVEECPSSKNDRRKTNKHYKTCRHRIDAVHVFHKTIGHIINVDHLWTKIASKDEKTDEYFFIKRVFLRRLIWWANAHNLILLPNRPQNF